MHRYTAAVLHNLTKQYQHQLIENSNKIKKLPLDMSIYSFFGALAQLWLEWMPLEK